MYRRIFILVLLSVLLIPIKGECCTSAIFSGKVTESGRPIIWKNRDGSYMQNRMNYIAASDTIKYSFIYLSNSKGGVKEAWSGLNSEGFSIMNTVSYNIRKEGDDTPDELMDMEGVLMFRALATCATLQDFEDLLDSLEAPFGLETNFGVIDAEGGAAYYEVNNYTWIKYDVNDPKVAPDGYIIRSNYSLSGREGQGQGYVRYDNASKIIKDRIAAGGKIYPKWVMDNLSRSYYQSQLGFDPLAAGNVFFLDKDFIPRRSTCAVTIAEGVNPGEDPLESVIWCALGYPPTSQIVPLMVYAGEFIPADVTARSENLNSNACNRSLRRKAKIFSPKRANGNYYIDLGLIKSEKAQSLEVEEKMMKKWNSIDKMNIEQLKAFYEEIEIR